MTTHTQDAQDTTSGTLARGLTILELIAAAHHVTPADIAAKMNISRSAAYRLVSQLRERGFISEHDSGGLRLGGAAVRLGLQALGDVDLYNLAAEKLQQLVATVEETAFLAIADGADVIYVLQEVGPSAVTMTAKPGSRRPLYCTALGKAYLSALPQDQMENLITGLDLQPVTASTITDVQTLREELATTRQRGYAIDNRELQPEVYCMAAPVLDHRGLPAASISVGGPHERLRARQEEILTALTTCAAELSAELGAPDLKQTH